MASWLPDWNPGAPGESKPVASNDTPEGRALNRRVELVRLEFGSDGIQPGDRRRLKSPEPENWLMLRGNYQGWMYSPLSQINTHNVKNLTPVWSYATGVDSGHEAPPIINDGVMFVATPYDQLLALDARTGDLLWRYQRELPEGFGALHNTKRGVALHGDKVYMTGQDAVLVALNAETGEVAWESEPVADWHQGYYMTMAPLIVNGKVMVGVSGGEFGVRGFIAAYDAESGQQVWKTYTVPGPGEPGHDTWEGNTWQRGGASVWMTGTYDPESNTAFWGTGNGSPWFGDQRPGDNLYTSSTVAIDPDSGAIKGHFQYHWNNSWDWDEMNAPMVVDYEKDGQAVKGLIKPSRNGYLYWLERGADGQIGYVNATNYVKQDVFASIDAKTGRPTYNDDHKPGTGKYAEFCPSLWGGKDWPYEAYNPNTGMVYIPANDNHCGSLEGKVQEYRRRPVVDLRRHPGHRLHGRQERQVLRRDPGMERQHRREGVDPSLSGDELGLDTEHGRRPGVQRRHQRSHVPGVRCAHRRAAVAVQDQLGDHGAAIVLRGRRRAVHRRAVGLGRRSRLPAGPDQRHPRYRPGGATGRRHLGVRAGAVKSPRWISVRRCPLGPE